MKGVWMRKIILQARTSSGFRMKAGCSLISMAVCFGAAGQAPAQSGSASTESHWGVTPYGSGSVQNDPLITAGAFSLQTAGGEMKEEQLKQLLVGKTLYLRDGYQDNNLEFDENGRLTSKSAQGSFTLSQIQVNKVRFSKHKLELQGDRFGLHFLGAAPSEDPTKATDRVKITPKKKTVRISFDREQVEKPKKEKKHKHKGDGVEESEGSEPANSKPESIKTDESSSKDEKGFTKTTWPAHASQLLLAALDKVFSVGVDERMIAAMPEFWRLYYEASAAKAYIKSTESGVLRQNAVDLKAKLVSVIDPPSNEYAQSSGIAGMALYHAVVGADGKVRKVVAGRPIGFGLDENAEKVIRNATFQPALKEGKAVPVALDLIVSFRIYSKRTSRLAAQEADGEAGSHALPGPYTAQVLEARGQQPDAAQSQSAPQH